jgi:hypothetical protein
MKSVSNELIFNSSSMRIAGNQNIIKGTNFHTSKMQLGGIYG